MALKDYAQRSDGNRSTIPFKEQHCEALLRLTAR